jgi:hypothetical protein
MIARPIGVNAGRPIFWREAMNGQETAEERLDRLIAESNRQIEQLIAKAEEIVNRSIAEQKKGTDHE